MRQPLPVLLTIAGAVMYQISSKTIPRAIHPLIAIVGAYVIAIAVCLVAMWRWPVGASISESVRQFNWSVAGIGVGAALIEVGFLLSYRSGWPLNLAAVVINVAAAVILIPLGFWMFDERLSLAKALGAVLCLAGLVLISRD
jgi:drug/metabolite transporter (DMT)-like permease